MKNILPLNLMILNFFLQSSTANCASVRSNAKVNHRFSSSFNSLFCGVAIIGKNLCQKTQLPNRCKSRIVGPWLCKYLLILLPGLHLFGSFVSIHATGEGWRQDTNF